MAKEDLIQSIRKLNPSAPADWLAQFSDQDLIAYLKRLQDIARAIGRPEAPLLALAG